MLTVLRLLWVRTQVELLLATDLSRGNGSDPLSEGMGTCINAREDGEDTRHVKRAVRFSEARVREYDRCIDYHPCVSCGVPIGLDWTFVETNAVRCFS